MTIWYRRLFWLIGIYSFQRLLFVFFNFESLKTVSGSAWLWAFLDGLRFDLCTIATINTPIIAAHYSLEYLIWWRKPAADKAEKSNQLLNRMIGVIFFATNIPLIIFGIIDSRMFMFTGRRSTLDLFAIMGDVQEQAFGIMLDYWQLTFLTIGIVVAMGWQTWGEDFGHRPGRARSNDYRVALLWSVLAALLIRGGWQTKPLSPAHAYSHQPVTLANAVLNSGITVLRTPSAQTLKPFHDFANMDDVRQVLKIKSNNGGQAKGKNVVIIIVESLACEYMGFYNQGRGYTPFLDSLATKSVVFRNSFASGRRTIDAIPAIFAAIPAWRDQPFITSPYAANQIRPLPRELSKIGYKSAFFHAASTGSMHFDVFAKLAGFDAYYGREDYPDKRQDDGHWGIFDEPFLQFSLDKITEMPQPFLAGIFTLSSHNPFKIPKEHQGKFSKGTLPIHESIGYADYSLQEFFKTAAEKSWFKDTIFVITGDHTSLSSDSAYNNLPGRHRVPMMVYEPSGKLPKSAETKVASHIDITPTIFGLLGLQFDVDWLMGGPLFDSNWDGRFIQHEYGTWFYQDQSLQILLREEQRPNFFAADDRDLSSELANHDDLARLQRLKATRQYYINGLLGNSWLTSRVANP
jgi:hypothetical protein